MKKIIKKIFLIFVGLLLFYSLIGLLYVSTITYNEEKKKTEMELKIIPEVKISEIDTNIDSKEQPIVKDLSQNEKSFEERLLMNLKKPSKPRKEIVPEKGIIEHLIYCNLKKAFKKFECSNFSDPKREDGSSFFQFNINEYINVQLFRQENNSMLIDVHHTSYETEQEQFNVNLVVYYSLMNFFDKVKAEVVEEILEKNYWQCQLYGKSLFSGGFEDVIEVDCRKKTVFADYRYYIGKRIMDIYDKKKK